MKNRRYQNKIKNTTILHTKNYMVDKNKEVAQTLWKPIVEKLTEKDWLLDIFSNTSVHHSKNTIAKSGIMEGEMLLFVWTILLLKILIGLLS